MKNASPLGLGLRHGIPIGAGYFAVAFSLGIIAGKAGLSPADGFFSSILTRASAGEYGTYSLMAAGAAYIEVFILSVIANLRYLLMGTALVQKFDPRTPQWKRLLASACITDEVFAISISWKGKLPVSYTTGAMLVSGVMWACGTACGIWAGDVMPASLVSALGVALYGMFIAIIIEPAKKERPVLIAVAVSFALSSICAHLPIACELSSGIRIVLLTIIISAAIALIKPVAAEEEMDRPQ